MDRKSIIALVICFVLLMAWFPLANKLYPPKPLPETSNTLTGVTNRGVVTNAAPNTFLQASPTNQPAVVPIIAAGPETLVTLEADGVVYTFTSQGGGLKTVELKNYPEVIERKPDPTKTIRGAILNSGAPFPAMMLTGHEAMVGDGVFMLSRKGQVVRAEKKLASGLLVVKEFQPGSNYLLQARVRIENTSGQPLPLPSQHVVVGTAVPVGTEIDPMQMGAFVNTVETTEHVDDAWFDNRYLGCFPGTPRLKYESTGSTVAWGAVHDRFFTLAVVPQKPAKQFEALHVELNREPVNGLKPRAIQASLVFPGVMLGTDSTNRFVELQFMVYAGPKEYNGLARIAADMKNDLDHIMKFNGFFGFFSKALLLSMNWFHDAIRLPYGWCIICITVIIKLLFWPLTQASTKSMKRMSSMQPQMKAIQDKYKDEPQKMNRKMMEFMKENKVNPMGGCLPMIIQIPVFFGFYYMIQSAIELRGASFLWAWDLSRADTIFEIAGFPINPLPLIMGVTMFWQAQMTPPSPGMDPTQQKIMKYMPLMFMFILYKMSAGLTLYWTVQNLLTIAQTKLTKTDPQVVKPEVTAPPRKR